MDLRLSAKKLETQMIQWRRDLHRIPETGLHLPQTAAYIANELRQMGIRFQENVGGSSSLVGYVTGDDSGKTIALRADMDGLALKEETGVSYASNNGNMHACGHDAHAAMLLGAARMLQDHRDQLKGNVKLIFQAGEEGPGGALPLIKAGALEHPTVSAVLGLHVGIVSNEIQSGMIGICYGKMMACMDRFTIRVRGKGCHGAYPESGVDPIILAAQMIIMLQTLVSREIGSTEPVVITVGKINGGSAFNIIPDMVELEGTVRAVDKQVRNQVARRMKEMTESIATSMRGKADFEYHYGYPPLVNHAEFTAEFLQTAKKIVGEENIVEIKTPVMGGEDMAYFLEAVPGTFFFLGSVLETEGIVYPHHSSRFNLDEDVFVTGAELLAQGAFDWIQKTSHHD